MEIEKISNGFILRDKYGIRKCFYTLDGLFQHLLLEFEERSETFGGNFYGKVIIERKPTTRK